MIKSNIWPEPILCEQCRVNNAEPGQRICYSCRHSADRPESTVSRAMHLFQQLENMCGWTTIPQSTREWCIRLIEQALVATPTREGWQTTVNGPGYVDKTERRLLLEWDLLSKESREKVQKWFDLAEERLELTLDRKVAARCPHCGSTFGTDMIGKNCIVCCTANVVGVSQ